MMACSGAGSSPSRGAGIGAWRASRRRAQVERLLRGALRHRDGRCPGAGRSSARSVPAALDILGPSDRFVKPRRVLAVLAASELCGMAPWFSASAVAPALSRVWRLDSAGGAWVTISVQLGFVAGALVSALLTLSDRWSARRLVAACACLAGLMTVGVAFAPGSGTGIALRMLTGAALAGVYPPGMKIVAGWYREGRGLAIGVLVGALTLGSALPHLVRWAVPVEQWRPVLIIAPARRTGRRAVRAG